MGRYFNSGNYIGTRRMMTTSTGNPPLMSDPYSVFQKVDSKNNIITERYYDFEGKADYDVDFTNHGNPKTHPDVPHKHIWDWTGTKPKRGKADGKL